MKLYKKVPKRIAKKYIGRYWHKLNFARHLKPGDLVSTCKGWNEVISEITPEWANYGRFSNRIIMDFDIITESGSSHSMVHCCEGHLQSLDEILKFWTKRDTPERKRWFEEWGGGTYKWEDTLSHRINNALSSGKVVFFENGTLNPDFEV
jgi:hypothetical protein